jgi:hypothetical protein
VAREDLPPDFLQSPLLPGLEVAGNSGFVDSTAFHETDPAVGRESAVGEGPKGPVPVARLLKPRVQSIVPKADNRFYPDMSKRYNGGGDCPSTVDVDIVNIFA